MAMTITAVYENGVLRPLSPLALPEHSQVELAVQAVTAPAQAARERVRAALARAGVLAERSATEQTVLPLGSDERAVLAQRLADAGVAPLSAAILDERAGR
jgi:predicted DNA-binding antitoxin AbrB/MazE fold protein